MGNCSVSICSVRRPSSPLTCDMAPPSSSALMGHELWADIRAVGSRRERCSLSDRCSAEAPCQRKEGATAQGQARVTVSIHPAGLIGCRQKRKGWERGADTVTLETLVLWTDMASLQGGAVDVQEAPLIPPRTALAGPETRVSGQDGHGGAE